jgi:hypothetical protein
MLKLTGKFRQKVSVQTVQLYSLKHGLYRSAFILASRARNLRGAAKYGKQSLGVLEKQKMYGQMYGLQPLYPHGRSAPACGPRK